MNKGPLTSLSVIVFLFVSFIPHALSEPGTEVKLSKSEITPEEPVSLELGVSWPKAEGPYKIAFPAPQTQNLRLVRQGESQETFVKNGIAREKKIFRFEYMPIAGGSARIEPFTITYLSPDGTKAGEFQSAAHEVSVRRAGASWGLQHAAAAGFAIVFLLSILAILLRVRQKNTAKEKDEEILSEEDRLLRELNGFWEKSGRSNPSLLPRYLQRKFLEYLAAKYGLAGTRTHNRDEVLLALSSRIQKADEMPRIERIFQELTEACYSGNPLDERDAAHLLDEVSRFIEGKRVLGRPA